VNAKLSIIPSLTRCGRSPHVFFVKQTFPGGWQNPITGTGSCQIGEAFSHGCTKTYDRNRINTALSEIFFAVILPVTNTGKKSMTGRLRGFVPEKFSDTLMKTLI